MKVSDAITYCIHFHKINSRPNTVANYEFLLGKFGINYQDRDIDSISTEEIIAFLAGITEGRKQNTSLSELKNPCLSPAVKNLFQKPKNSHWTTFDKDTVDEAIFRTLNLRNRLLLELMARAGMRVSEVLGLKPKDIDGQKLVLHSPKSGREQEIVFIPKKISTRLQKYVRDTSIAFDQLIFPITYAGARNVVVKVGDMVGIRLLPHDLRRHADLSTTQRYLGKVSDDEAIRWVESLHG